jgi:hypothetical protein
MELGPDILASLTWLQGMDHTVLKGLLWNPNGAPAEAPSTGTPAPPVAVLPPIATSGIPIPPRTILEKCGSTSSDLLLPHYVTYLPPFEWVFPSSKVV